MQLKDLLADMTPGKLLSLLTDAAKDYKQDIGTKGVKRNAPNTEYYGPEPSQELVDALLTDFVNFVGIQWGVDWAMYARNLNDPKRGLGNEKAGEKHVP